MSKVGSSISLNTLKMIPRRLPRRERLIVLVAVALIITYFTFSPQTITVISEYTSNANLDPWKPPKHSGPGLKIALVNTPRYHFEVVTPLLYAFANQGDAVEHLELFATDYGSTRLGVRPILDNQLPQETSWLSWGSNGGTKKQIKVSDPRLLSQMNFVADVMILTSCSRDLEWTSIKDKRVYNPEWYRAPKEIVCLLHEAEEWEAIDTNWRKFLMPWVEKGRVTFMTLSPHVAEYVRQNIETKWKMAPILRDAQGIGIKGVFMMDPFIPIFEDTKLFREEMFNNITGPFAAIPGKYEPFRRNYTAIFEHMSKHLELIQSTDATLRLPGYGDWPPNIPEQLKNRVFLHSHYDFPEYFSLLARSMAILPAFATHKYFEDRASSTIATSVIAGVPLVATKELVEKYAYIEADGAWLQEDGEEEIVTWLRVLKLGKEEWETRKRKVRALRTRLIRQNLRNVGQLLDQIRWRNKARGF
ncbi:hypothetical protein TWF225_003809 [Orbilia oligospora]|uniref:Glycosyl transferase family 1 domain-containing protein n=1 Tax=Orbilia oligospora TaxID=2813651 RepID=A0A7C8NW03_ORBOL|nr:hypothetical protein TWF102_010761 [Orbilia oligospora]KAF3111530.1 hypothetical protein TWF103_003479 [Orbilia oligospora]KAF3147923.1 hypothetical protein TWF594_001856 [Orbilia oligospora]KAF3176392.1 hypothetical protein TWF751_003440 [Orbilia oligospora]KAF3195424.1 hypothetical protein TWF225_003809 [Orbilia oligospora]